MAANFGYIDSVYPPVNMTMSIPSLDYDKDFSLAESSAGSVVLANITTPVDQPETLRYAITNVSDVYKNSDIQPIHRQQGLKGKKVLISLRDTARVSQDNTVVDYPIKVGLTVEYPVSANLDSNDIFRVIKRAVAATQDVMLDGTTANDLLINKLCRGALNPQDGKEAIVQI